MEEKEVMVEMKKNLKKIERLKIGANKLTGKMMMYFALFLTAFLVVTAIHNFLIVNH